MSIERVRVETKAAAWQSSGPEQGISEGAELSGYGDDDTGDVVT
jgi:hypothetical protein